VLSGIDESGKKSYTANFDSRKNNSQFSNKKYLQFWISLFNEFIIYASDVTVKFDLNISTLQNPWSAGQAS